MCKPYVIGPILWICLVGKALFASVATEVNFHGDPMDKVYCVVTH